MNNNEFTFVSKSAAINAIEDKLNNGWKVFRGNANLDDDFVDLLGHGIHFAVSEREGQYVAQIWFSNMI